MTRRGPAARPTASPGRRSSPALPPVLVLLVLVLVLVLLAGCAQDAPGAAPTAAGPTAADAGPALPPVDVRVDYQLGGSSPPADGVGIVVRDWDEGHPLPGGWSVCYVNAFQTQPDSGADRRDERSAWPPHLVLSGLGEDPGWPGELLVDISTPARREEAAAWLGPVLRTCADKGFDAVELDNLDSWTRFDGTPRQGDVPFGRPDAVAYAALLARTAHDLGLAVAQKNTPQLTADEALGTVGFDLAVAEQCGRYDECPAYTALYGRAVLVVEYDDEGFARACEQVGDQVAVVRRDAGLGVPGAPGYVARWC